MRARNLNVGLESISRWQVEDENHLPVDKALGPAFLPKYRPLDEILRRPSLDERLPDLLQPELLDGDMLEPAMLTQLRKEAMDIMSSHAARSVGSKRDTFEKAAEYLGQDVHLDDEIRAALGALLQG